MLYADKALYVVAGLRDNDIKDYITRCHITTSHYCRSNSVTFGKKGRITKLHRRFYSHNVFGSKARLAVTHDWFTVSHQYEKNLEEEKL